MNFITFLTACCSLALSWAHDWGYPDLVKNMDAPFPKWGGTCDSGKRQSPINLDAKGSLKGQFPPLKFENYDKQQKHLKMVNNGHSVRLTGFDPKLTLSGGALLHDHVVEGLHMHWWSEHTINDIRYPLEVHIVHRNTIYPNMSMAIEFPDGIVVIGVLYHVSNIKNKAIGSILKSLGAVKTYDRINTPTLMADSLAVDDLVPRVESYFTYAGSLTSPNCAEAVTWIVLTETFPVTLDQVNEFKEIEFEEGKQLHNNYRELQSENNRGVVLVEKHSGEAGATAAVSVILPLVLTGQKFLL